MSRVIHFGEDGTLKHPDYAAQLSRHHVGGPAPVDGGEAIVFKRLGAVGIMSVDVVWWGAYI